jgi:hypothetical protein
MKRIALATFALVVACGGGDDASDGKTEGDASTDLPSAPTLDAATEDAPPVEDATNDGAPDPCADAGLPPSTLECAGLYSDFASQKK